MKRPSTRNKGDAFEQRVAEILLREIKAGAMGLIPPSAELRTAPRYHSNDRGGPIQFDLSIELRLDPALAPSLTIIIECKDYAGSIDVGELEEFKAKLDQCFGKNVKAMFVTTAVLQQGALNYARAQGICVVRIIENGEMEIMMACMVDGSKAAFREAADQMAEDKAWEAQEALLDYDFPALDSTFGLFDTFAIDGEHQFARAGDLLYHLGKPVVAQPRPT
ncbi:MULTISPECIES: restriction endonuclease [unclassified Sphingomonas]|uniref:restriction endonuclease n=1 Tax=unclassified Sphingomonas TaxID=196159 RepID=UPI00070135A1|nr:MULTISPECIES: restriction endonuclease [unclassified Sphingomonas]KQX19184.1 hypothetical protein ASD17_11520 [Sphingomonas sp. Root1294]KQY65385.1 hypothetical protein ASD39_14715 [Sphingomonas sp. Root50]KRB95320.1 hypothetical protein ASE22_05340 [Sphingomonas sp. Root720]